MKALLHYRASPGFREHLRARAAEQGIEVAVIEEEDEVGFRRESAVAQVLLHVLKPVTREMIAAAPELRLIQKIGVGVNTIDLEAARERGVAVANMPGTNSQAVAEMTLMLILATLRQVTYLDALTRAGEGWRPDLARLDRIGEIAGRTVGFVGFGAVPQALAPALAALGAKIVYFATSAKPGQIARYVPLAELLAVSDIISLHLPATSETRGLIGADALALMKSGAILINTARGELVDEAALGEALKNGRIAGTGLDVFAREPAAAANPLLALPNVVVTPHVAWLTPETLARSLDVAFENCRRLATGQLLLNQVI
ncbi:MAG: NAD(P)-dependent oxidoreductase [Caulobacteraceae bacterium]